MMAPEFLDHWKSSFLRGQLPEFWNGEIPKVPVPRQAPSRRDFLASAWDPQEPRKWAPISVPNAPWDGKPDFAGTTYCRTSIYPAIAYSPMSMGPMSMFPLNVVFFQLLHTCCR